GAIGLNVRERVLTSVDPPLQLCSLSARRSNPPVRIRADSEPPLPPCSRSIVEDEGTCTGRRGATAKSLHLGIVIDAISDGREGQGLYDAVSQFLSHDPRPRVRTVSVPGRVTQRPMLS